MRSVSAEASWECKKRQLLLTSSLCRLSFLNSNCFVPIQGAISRTDDVLLYCHQQLFLSSQKKIEVRLLNFRGVQKITPIGFQEGSLRENISHKIKLSILEDKAQTKKELIVLIWYNSELCKKMSLHCQRWCWAKVHAQVTIIMRKAQTIRLQCT